MFYVRPAPAVCKNLFFFNISHLKWHLKTTVLRLQPLLLLSYCVILARAGPSEARVSASYNNAIWMSEVNSRRLRTIIKRYVLDISDIPGQLPMTQVDSQNPEPICAKKYSENVSTAATILQLKSSWVI